MNFLWVICWKTNILCLVECVWALVPAHGLSENRARFCWPWHAWLLMLCATVSHSFASMLVACQMFYSSSPFIVINRECLGLFSPVEETAVIPEDPRLVFALGMHRQVILGQRIRKVFSYMCMHVCMCMCACACRHVCWELKWEGEVRISGKESEAGNWFSVQKPFSLVLVSCGCCDKLPQT